MRTLITNASVLDMVGDTANIEKKDILDLYEYLSGREE